MNRRCPPRLALALLERFVADSEPLAGDLVEEFEGQRRSAAWFWLQVVAAIAAGGGERDVEIRPLHLVDLQPAEASERSRAIALRFRPVNLSGSSLSGVGGLGLVIFGTLLTVFTPAALLVFLASALAGIAFGILVIVMRDHAGSPHRRSAILSESGSR